MHVQRERKREGGTEGGREGRREGRKEGGREGEREKKEDRDVCIGHTCRTLDCTCTCICADTRQNNKKPALGSTCSLLVRIAHFTHTQTVPTF